MKLTHSMSWDMCINIILLLLITHPRAFSTRDICCLILHSVVVVVMALDLRLDGREFDFRPPRLILE